MHLRRHPRRQIWLYLSRDEDLELRFVEMEEGGRAEVNCLILYAMVV